MTIKYAKENGTWEKKKFKSSHLPGIIGPICSDRTVGPQAQSLLTGSHDTEIKKPMSSIESVYEAVVAPRISTGVPSEVLCKDTIFFNQMV